MISQKREKISSLDLIRNSLSMHLRVIDEEEVSLYMVNPKAPCFIKDDEGKFIYLILPVNFNAATN